MTCTPMALLAIHLEISSEMKAPPKPKIAAKISRPDVVCPCWRELAIEAEQLDDQGQQQR